MKTDVSIKFNSIEEYRVIEKKLEEMGYFNDKGWNDYSIFKYNKCLNLNKYVTIEDNEYFSISIRKTKRSTYNNLEEFLND